MKRKSMLFWTLGPIVLAVAVLVVLHILAINQHSPYSYLLF